MDGPRIRRRVLYDDFQRAETVESPAALGAEWNQTALVSNNYFHIVRAYSLYPTPTFAECRIGTAAHCTIALCRKNLIPPVAYVYDGCAVGHAGYSSVLPTHPDPVWAEAGVIACASDVDNCYICAAHVVETETWDQWVFSNPVWAWRPHWVYSIRIYKRVGGVQTLLGERTTADNLSQIGLLIGSSTVTDAQGILSVSADPLLARGRFAGIYSAAGPGWPTTPQRTTLHGIFNAPPNLSWRAAPASGESPVIQVIRGTENFPTSEFEFSGAAADLVDYGAYQDASAYDFTRVGDRTIRLGAALAGLGYGNSYGNNY